ncbi:hypothetical protein BGW42_006144 [Actinomortierella wolfii]|nr:hypothetical protein BGW42_006144 [Actinomortierella wolfii]
MLSKASSSSFSTFALLVFVAILSLLTSAPSPASAACTLECTELTAKITFCGSIFRDGITDELPRIGVDAKLDNCLCNQAFVHDLNRCYFCKNPQTVNNITNQFINDCKILSNNKNLVNGAAAPTKSTLVGVLAVVSAIAMAVLA